MRLSPSKLQEVALSLTEAERAVLNYKWNIWAREKQLTPEGLWFCWLVLAGRGFGKTRMGSEEVRKRIEDNPDTKFRIALVAETAADARDVMVEGESGILAISPPWNKPHYEPSKRQLTWPNGSIAKTYSAEEPDQLRGPQHHFAWCDEPAKWKYLKDTWDNLLFGLRLGTNPQVCVTTTPRPLKFFKELIRDETTVVTQGTTYENRANLPKAFFDQIIKRYEGTRIGRQELNAEILEDIAGALWNRAWFDRDRIKSVDKNSLDRIVVAIDPAVTSGEESDETGIIVAARKDEEYFILEDLSGRYGPTEWARVAATAYERWRADIVIGEANNGGDMIEAVLRNVDKSVNYKKVIATRGKTIRAEPIAMLYEKGQVHHVGSFPTLEDQMAEFTLDYNRTRDGSPDRMDADVWALTELSGGNHFKWDDLT